MLGDRDRRHLQLDRLIEQLVDPARAVEQRELGVQMKMDELRHVDCDRQMQHAIAWTDPDLANRLDDRHSHSIVDGGFELMS